MILSVGLNPILETRYYMKELYQNTDNKAERVIYNLGGDGLVLARILNSLNLDVFATGFLGGLCGEQIFEELKHLGIYNDFTRIKDESRRDLLLIEENKVNTLIEEDGPRITREELGSFYQLYNNLLDNSDIVCGVGNLPLGVHDEFYGDLIHMSHRKGKKFILDANGKELAYGLEAKPFMVKLNKDALEDLTRIKINFTNEVISLGQGIIQSGVELVVIDLEHRGSIVLTREMGYRLDIPTLSEFNLERDRGYMSAGYIFGFDRSYDLETSMRLGQSFRIAYGTSDLGIIDMADIKKIMSTIDITPINY